MKQHEFQKLVDQNLSGLQWDEQKRQRVLDAICEEERPVKKISATALLFAAILCLTVSALAGGLMFSGRVDREKLAEEALQKAYGITQPMLSYFAVTEEEKADGMTVVTYEGLDELGYVLGTYTVTVKGHSAEAKWSRDGEDTTGGLDADAWGREQLEEMLLISRAEHEVKSYYEKAGAINEKHGLTGKEMPGTPVETEEESAVRHAKEAADVRARQKLSDEEIKALAREALVLHYQLTEGQEKLLRTEEDMNMLRFVGDQPCMDVFFFLLQDAGTDPDVWPEWTEKDGQYWVSVNVESGVIEKLLYDSGLNGNG
ncbi:MAG: hypothetical protein IJ083_13225 [Clostridia bacterium]|nr:hypothetical protein [Clostridia bacterium]